MAMIAFTDGRDGYYQFDDTAPPEWYAHLTPTALRLPAPAPIPTVVTMRQARLALLNAGLLTSVSNAIAAMTGTAGDAARIEWEFSPTLKRDHPLVASLSVSLGLTSAQLDSLFTAASIL